jgi:ribonuclease HI
MNQSRSSTDVQIYTDGACSGNPGPGGWAAILLYGSQEKVISGGFPETTNNRMELQSAIEGLKALNRSCRIALYSDSAYLVDAMTKGWLNKWQQNGWKTSVKDDVKNRDLWIELSDLIGKHCVTWIKVKGHSDNEYNNRCDAYARGEIKRFTEREEAHS